MPELRHARVRAADSPRASRGDVKRETQPPTHARLGIAMVKSRRHIRAALLLI